MRNKIIGILVVVMLVLTSVVIIVPDNLKVEAVPGEEGIDNNTMGLPYEFMFNLTKALANVIHVVYNNTDIPMGRAFATKGDCWTAEYILKYEMNQIGLENVTKIPLGPVKDVKYKEWYYTSKVETNNYQLTIDDDDYPFPNDVPMPEVFVFPSGFKNNDTESGTMNYNYTFPHCRVHLSAEDFVSDIYPLGGSYTGDYKNVSFIAANEKSGIVGNVTYVDTNEPLPQEQEGKLFLMKDEQGCEDKLDNVTNATAVILIHNNTLGSHSVLQNISKTIISNRSTTLRFL